MRTSAALATTSLVGLLPGSPTEKLAWASAIVGLVVYVVGFAASFFLRMQNESVPSGVAIALAIAGTVLASVTGWLGGELVGRMGVGVDPGANLNASSSLSRRGGEDHRMAAD